MPWATRSKSVHYSQTVAVAAGKVSQTELRICGPEKWDVGGGAERKGERERREVVKTRARRLELRPTRKSPEKGALTRDASFSMVGALSLPAEDLHQAVVIRTQVGPFLTCRRNLSVLMHSCCSVALPPELVLVLHRRWCAYRQALNGIIFSRLSKQHVRAVDMEVYNTQLMQSRWWSREACEADPTTPWARLRDCQCVLEVWLRHMQLTGDVYICQREIRETTASCNGEHWVAELHLRSYHTDRRACAPEYRRGHVYTNAGT